MGIGVLFESIVDPRSVRNQHHSLAMLIGTTLLAGLCGIDSFSGIADFVECHEEGLKEYFAFPHGAPSHDTYQRLWDSIAPSGFHAAFFAFTQTLAVKKEGVLAVDGKTIRNSGTDKPFHIVSAWCTANRLALSQRKVGEKSNEITAIPELLAMLDLNNRIVTIDAMGAQRAICEQIVSKGGDYLIALKGNQGNLHKDIALFLQDKETQKSCLAYEENDKGHGRLEQRIAYVTGDIKWLKEQHDWPGLASVGMIQATVTKKGKTTGETRYYISSLPPDARTFAETARAHWGIENTLHWSLDVVFNEDKAAIRNDNAAENMDIIRKWALNILQKAKSKPEQSIKSIMRKNAMNQKNLFNIVKKFLHA